MAPYINFNQTFRNNLIDEIISMQCVNVCMLNTPLPAT